jgi:hypothetical protein
MSESLKRSEKPGVGSSNLPLTTRTKTFALQGFSPFLSIRTCTIPGPLRPKHPDHSDRHDHLSPLRDARSHLRTLRQDRLGRNMAAIDRAPPFFANVLNALLSRRYFLTIPPEINEAATIDGAGPFRTLRSMGSLR